MRWISNPRNSPKAKTLQRARRFQTRISPAALPVLADLLVSRGIDEPKRLRAFFRRSERSSRPAADERHENRARSAGSGIGTQREDSHYGDYDVDGTTAIVILKTAIELCAGG